MKRTNLACTVCLAPALVACVLMQGNVSAAGPRPGAAARPNIVFVEVDDLTYSYAGCFGSRLAKTPHIDSLARHGVLFKNATCRGMMCGPSRNWCYQQLQAKGLLEHFKTEFPQPSSLPEDDYLDGLFTKTAIDFLDSYDADKPLFLWLNYSLPHGPYDVNQKYLDQFSPADMPVSTKAQFTPPAKLVADAKPIRSEW